MGRDYDKEFPRDYDKEFPRDYDKEFPRDYDKEQYNEGKDYDKKHPRDYGKDYANPEEEYKEAYPIADNTNVKNDDKKKSSQGDPGMVSWGTTKRDPNRISHIWSI